MDLFKNLGQALRWLRNRQGRSQLEIAAAAGITKAMVSTYETGKQSPTLPTLSKILVALGADLADLQSALLLHQGKTLPPLDHKQAGGTDGAAGS